MADCFTILNFITIFAAKKSFTEGDFYAELFNLNLKRVIANEGLHSYDKNIQLHEAKQMYQKEIVKLKMETASGRKIAERMLQQLQSPQDRLLQVYDLTREEDVEAYLEWYRLLQRHVPQDLIDRLESSPRYLAQAPLTLLRNKVQQYHASLE